MLKKIALAAIAASTLGLAALGTSAPANAQVYFGFGMGGPYYHHRHWHPRYYPDRRCGWQMVRRHHRWVRVWRCAPVWY